MIGHIITSSNNLYLTTMKQYSRGHAPSIYIIDFFLFLWPVEMRFVDTCPYMFFLYILDHFPF